MFISVEKNVLNTSSQHLCVSGYVLCDESLYKMIQDIFKMFLFLFIYLFIFIFIFFTFFIFIYMFIYLFYRNFNLMKMSDNVAHDIFPSVYSSGY